MKVAVVVQGLFEKSDSIGFDAVYQFDLLRRAPYVTEAALFAEQYDKALYDSVPISDVSELEEWLTRNPESTLIYHFCDGWERLERTFVLHGGRRVLRWHNNTPPWFYAGTNIRLVKRTIAGFDTVIALLKDRNIEVWTNSHFSKRQLELLSGKRHIHIIYPSSRFLGDNSPPVEPQAGPDDFDQDRNATHILFVSRKVAHKGHQHLLALGRALRELEMRPVLHFVGRSDKSSQTYDTTLDDLASEVGIQFIDHGEVSHEALKDIYDRADMFVSLSEHEGFGMPIFEAMRRGLPVVAWANSALAELMDGHPFATTEYDISFIAACCLMLQRTANRDRLRAIQSSILNRYTEDVVHRQIETAMRGVDPTARVTSDEGTCGQANCLRFEATALADSIRPRVEAALSSLDLAHDFNGNYVSLHDLTAYKHFANRIATLESGLLQTPSGSGAPQSLYLRGERFSSHFGRHAASAIALPQDHYQPHHLIFGPYIALPEGRFEVTFEFDISPSSPPPIDLRAEVANSEALFACKHHHVVTAGPQTIVLEIDARCPITSCEFRLWLNDSAAFEMVFKGLEVKRVRTITEISGLDVKREVTRYVAERSSQDDARHPRGLTRFKWFGAKPNRGDTAQGIFDAADRLRDAGSWALAAEAYSSGLALRPNQSEYWVQLGNVSKEAKLYDQAENAYFTAIRLNPESPEVHLQLGHLRKVQGRITDAEAYYLQAVFHGLSVCNALKELKALGNQLDSILTLIETSQYSALSAHLEATKQISRFASFSG